MHSKGLLYKQNEKCTTSGRTIHVWAVAFHDQRSLQADLLGTNGIYHWSARPRYYHGFHAALLLCSTGVKQYPDWESVLQIYPDHEPRWFDRLGNPEESPIHSCPRYLPDATSGYYFQYQPPQALWASEDFLARWHLNKRVGTVNWIHNQLFFAPKLFRVQTRYQYWEDNPKTQLGSAELSAEQFQPSHQPQSTPRVTSYADPELHRLMLKRSDWSR